MWNTPPPIYVAWAKHNRHQWMLLQLWLYIKLHVLNKDPLRPPQVLGSIAMVDLPTKSC